MCGSCTVGPCRASRASLHVWKSAVGLLECDRISAVDQLFVLMIEVPLGNRAAGCLCLQGVQQHASCRGKSLGAVGSDPDAWSFFLSHPDLLLSPEDL